MPETLLDEALVEAIQVDRERAIPFVGCDYTKCGGFSDGYWITNGEYDEHPLVQAFARARLDALASLQPSEGNQYQAIDTQRENGDLASNGNHPQSASLQPSVSEMRGWQTVANAPLDGTAMLLAREFFGPGDWRIKVGGWNVECGCWKIFGASWAPTHWMPLPDPPALSPEGEP